MAFLEVIVPPKVLLDNRNLKGSEKWDKLRMAIGQLIKNGVVAKSVQQRIEYDYGVVVPYCVILRIKHKNYTNYNKDEKDWVLENGVEGFLDKFDKLPPYRTSLYKWKKESKFVPAERWVVYSIKEVMGIIVKRKEEHIGTNQECINFRDNTRGNFIIVPIV